MNTSLKARVQGFTLIELMISMAIGLVIALAAVQLFVTGFSSYNLQKGLGDVNENGRFALEFIARDIRDANYWISVNSSGDPAFAVQAADLPSGTAALVSADALTNTGLGNSDQMVVREWVPLGTTTIRDCEGNLVPEGNYKVSRYFLRADVASGSASALACDGGYYVTGAATVTNYGDQGVVMLPSVDNFQVLYGIVDPNSRPLGVDRETSSAMAVRAPVRYVTMAQYVALAAPRPDIGSVRLGLMVRSSEGVGKFAGTPPDMRVLDVTISGSTIPAAEQSRVRRVFSSTVMLRNVM